MTSEGNSALLPANVDRGPPLLRGLMNFQLYNNTLNDWSRGKQLILCPSKPPRLVIKCLILGEAEGDASGQRDTTLQKTAVREIKYREVCE